MKDSKGIRLNDKLITIDNITIEDIELLFDFDKNVMLEYRLKLGKKYIDTHFPENQKLFKRLQQSIKKNIELTDPKNFKNVKDPLTHKKLLSIKYVSNNEVAKKKLKLQNRNKKTAARFFKKPRIKTSHELIDEKIAYLENELKKFENP